MSGPLVFRSDDKTPRPVKSDISRPVARSLKIPADSTKPCIQLHGVLTKNAKFIGAWRSLVARLLWEQKAGGSNPSAPMH